MLPFLITMLALLILGLAVDARWLSGTAVILLGNWIAEVAMVQCSGEQFPWLFFMVADYLAALIILCIRPNRWQVVVAGIYAVQIVFHAAYGLSKQDAWARYDYWHGLTYTGWAQLAAIIGGGLYALHRRYRGADRGVSHSFDVLGRSGKGDL
jgi:hypothetical protein